MNPTTYKRRREHVCEECEEFRIWPDRPSLWQKFLWCGLRSLCGLARSKLKCWPSLTLLLNIYNPATYWPSTFFKIKLRLVAPGWPRSSHGFWFWLPRRDGTQIKFRIGGVENTKCHNHKHGASLVHNPKSHKNAWNLLCFWETKKWESKHKEILKHLNLVGRQQSDLSGSNAFCQMQKQPFGLPLKS